MGQSRYNSALYSEVKNGSGDLSNSFAAIVDMRADFASGVDKLAATITRSATYSDKLPHALNYKFDKIVYILPTTVLLTLAMIITEIWTYGPTVVLGFGFANDQDFGRALAYVRDIIHGSISEIILLVPLLIGSIVSTGALVLIFVLGYNFVRRRIAGNQLWQLRASALLITGIVLVHDILAVILDIRVSNVNRLLVKQGKVHLPLIRHQLEP